MTKQELMAELQDVRYYNTHREMFRKAENTGFKADALQKIGKYADLIRTAPCGCKWCITRYLRKAKHRRIRQRNWASPSVTRKALCGSYTHICWKG